ncbi:hypothetical protein KKF55_04485 [Patescibacteria group bacterium]|nr:hypothetical protein [Patescibacteria group bacterium]
MKFKFILVCALFSLSLPLVSCNKSSDEDVAGSVLSVSGAKSSVFSAILISSGKSDMPVRPGSPLGMYVSLYLAQQNTLGVISALEGIDSQIRLARADSITEDETFSLLQEYGTILQVNIIDTLNRSIHREDALNKYTLALKQMNMRMQQKRTELDQKLKDTGEKRSGERKEVRDMERSVKSALREKDYATAGPKQQELALLEVALAETESKEKQTKKVLDIVKDLLEVGEERLEAITKNREILIAGLQIVNVPGIEELGIVIEE